MFEFIHGFISPDFFQVMFVFLTDSFFKGSFSVQYVDR